MPFKVIFPTAQKLPSSDTPGRIPAGREANGIQSHEDLYVTLAAAPGLPELKGKVCELRVQSQRLRYLPVGDAFA